MQKLWRWSALALTVYWCFFIWHFSLAGAGESAATSGRFLHLFNEALERAGSDFRFTGLTIRKTAHFVEFFALGFLISLTLRLYRFPHVIPFALPCVFAVATVDELLQFTSPGRGPALADVLLDTSGGICGILVFFGLSLLAFWLQKRILEKKSKKLGKTT